MFGELFYEVVQRINAVRGMEALLIFTVAAFHLAVMTGCMERMSLRRTPSTEAMISNKVSKSRLLFEKRR